MGNGTEKITAYKDSYQIIERAEVLEVPGRPKLVPAALVPIGLGSIDKGEHPKVEVYMLDLHLSEEEVLYASKLYKQRSRGLPWHVRVLTFAMHKSPCYCTDSKMSTIVVTEHIESRLANFRVSKGPSLHKYKEY